MIIFNGISSDEIGVIVEHYPRITVPKRRLELVEVPGRNQTAIIDHGTYENYEQTYEIFLDAKDRGGLQAVTQKLSAWLLSTTGYCRLEDSYYPDSYRMAFVENALEFSNYFGIYGRGTLTFNCGPQRYLKVGETEFIVPHASENSSNNSVTTTKVLNPTGFQSDPIIRFGGAYGLNTLKAVRDGVTQPAVTITVPIRGVTNTFTIDVKNHKFYRGDTLSPSFFSGNFEDLRLGKETSYIWTIEEGTLENGIMRLTPNWWTL